MIVNLYAELELSPEIATLEPNASVGCGCTLFKNLFKNKTIHKLNKHSSHDIKLNAIIAHKSIIIIIITTCC